MGALSMERRSLLGALALAPAVALPIAATTLPASTKLPALIATWRAATAECRRYEEHVYEPVKAAYDAACERVPHVTTKSSYMSNAGERRISTDDEIAIGSARGLLRHMAGKDGCAEWEAVLREAIAADDGREAEMDRLRELHHVDKHFARVSELEAAIDDAWDAVLDHEPTSRTELMLKLDVMEGAGEFVTEPSARVMLADVRRLAGGLA